MKLRLQFTGNVHGACGDDFYRLRWYDCLWLLIGGAVTTGSNVIYLWRHRP